MKTIRIRVICIAFLMLFSPSTSSAQFEELLINNDLFNTGDFGATPIAISLLPTHPQPGESVEASINDYSSSLYGSEITWYIDDIPVTDALNQRQIELTAPALGDTTEVRVVLKTPNGTEQVYNTTINPVFLDIILEPQTYVPDFYLGRAVPSLGSAVNATALVTTDTGMQTNNLVYTWQVNQQVIGGGPLRGGYKVTFPMPRGDEAILSVKATLPNGQTVSERAIVVSGMMPLLRFYEVSALFGTSHTALTNSFPLSGNTATVRAVPYYLDTRVYNDPDVAEWEINNQASGSSGSNPYEVTIQRTSTFGTAALDFHVRDTTEVLQGARGTLTVSF